MTLHLLPTERSCHKDWYTHVKYEGPNSYQSEDMACVKVFADKETDKQMDGRAKNYKPPIYLCGSIQILKFNARKSLKHWETLIRKLYLAKFQDMINLPTKFKYMAANL